MKYNYTLLLGLSLAMAPITLSCSDDGPAGSINGSGGAQQATGGSLASGGAGSDQVASGGTDSGLGTGGSGEANASGGTNGESASGGAAMDGSGGRRSDLAAPDCPPPEDLGIRLVGRYDGCPEQGVNMGWSGSGFIARFSGTGLSITQSGNAVQYTVVLDGEVQANLVPNTGEHSYNIVNGLPQGEHVVEVYRRGEASFGTTTLLSVEVSDGQLLDPPAPAERRIEIFGDSITCGYGNEGASASCPFSADTENHYLSYGAILARSFDADLSTVAWSGKGVVINYGGDTSTTLPEMAERADPNSEKSVWDYTLEPEPDAVVVNLGTNDFSTDNDPTADDFLNGYLGLLRSIRARYPDALIVCTLGPLLSGTDLVQARQGISNAVQTLSAAGDSRTLVYEMQAGNPNPGCDWHPSLLTHAAMAAELTVVLGAELGW